MDTKRIIILIVLTVFLLIGLSLAQPQSERWREMMGPERIEKYKKMRLLEVLNLQEEAAVRFNSKYNLHGEKLKELKKKEDELQNRLEEILMNQKALDREAKNLKKLLDEITESRNKVFDEDKKFLQEMRELLSSEQMAKYYLFQRNFERELRDAIREMRKDMPRHRMRE